MLENARRFFQATEYPLALRKVQEALGAGSQRSGALSLKAQIEKDRREKKISEWITLARQHLDNQAFRQAREALDNVLQLKPNETDALRLLAEVGRREQEVARIRDEKARLYQAAMQAWEKGEVSAAMTKLEVLMAMNRDLPESDSARSSSYQNFYNQVHSEHDAIKNSYDEARRNLSADNFEAALGICKQCLTKYPNHALFQALKFDVEERRRQNLSAVIADTDRRVDEEQDLDKRVGILEEAAQTLSRRAALRPRHAPGAGQARSGELHHRQGALFRGARPVCRSARPMANPEVDPRKAAGSRIRDPALDQAPRSTSAAELQGRTGSSKPTSTWKAAITIAR